MSQVPLPPPPRRYASMRARLEANSSAQWLHARDAARPWTAKPCRIWKGALNSQGYGKMSVRRKNDGKKKDRLAHRVSLADYLGVPVWRLNNVCHECDNRPCIEPSHLRSKTQRANILDCVMRGRHNSAQARAA